MDPIKDLSPRGNFFDHASHCQQTAVGLINECLITSGARSKGAVKQYARTVSVILCRDRWYFSQRHCEDALAKNKK